jgi:hypothetical protein
MSIEVIIAFENSRVVDPDPEMVKTTTIFELKNIY